MIGQQYVAEAVKYAKIVDWGWIKTSRNGPTGIGKTYEDSFGIPENNLKKSDTKLFEIKASRKKSGSLITLFTQAPTSKRGVIKQLVNTYGIYETKKCRYNFKHSLYAFKQKVINEIPICLSIENNHLKIKSENHEYGYWDKKKLEDRLNEKFGGAILHLVADSKIENGDEYFKLERMEVLCGELGGDEFFEAIRSGKIIIDFRAHRYKNAKAVRDHGTGFRISTQNLYKIYKEKYIIKEDDII